MLPFNWSHPSGLAPEVVLGIGSFGAERTLVSLDAYGNPVFCTAQGQCNTSGTTVTSTFGVSFLSLVPGTTLYINGTGYTVNSVQSATVCTLTTSAGTQSGVVWSFGSNAKGIGQGLLTTVTLAQIQAGKVILPGMPNCTIIPIHFVLKVNGTAGGSGNFILEDTNGAPVVIATVAEAQLAGVVSENTASITVGAGFLGALTTGAGVQIPASASLTTLTSVTVSLDYFLI